MNTIIKRCCSTLGLTGLALLASVSAGRANVVFNTFDSASEVANYAFSGWNGSPSGTVAFSTNNAAGGTSSGSIQLEPTFTSSGQGGAFLSSAAPVDVSTATNIEFDVMVDPASPLDPQGNVCYFQGGFNLNGGTYGFKIAFNPFWLGPSGTHFTPGVWQHFKLPIPIGNLGSAEAQFAIYPYNPNCTSTVTPIFYVDNIVFDTPNGPVVGPTMSISKPTKGLNVFASTSGLYDRQSTRLTVGQGWVGQASTGNPVTYSFTINGFPNVPVYSSEAYMFLVPNPVAHDNAPDYNEPNCIIAEVQSTSAGSQLILQYKANEAGANNMQYGNDPYTNAPGSWDGTTTPWYESGNLGSIQSTLLNGTYSLKFTSSSNITLIVPDGSSTNLVISPYYASYFASGSGFDVYLGMQANSAAGTGQAVSYANFSMSGTPNSFSDNFLTDTILNATNWDTSVASGPAGVVVVPATGAYWVDWTIPAPAFSLETGSNLLNLGTWTTPSDYPSFASNGKYQQLVDSTELPGGNVNGIGFFNMVKRSFTQLQVLLPGETNAPGTVSGKTGTPTPVSLSGDSGNENVTVYAVDASFHIISGVSDQITLSSADPNEAAPDGVSMVNGTATFTGNYVFGFGSQGSWTIMAKDVTNTNIPTATSSPVTVGP